MSVPQFPTITMLLPTTITLFIATANSMNNTTLHNLSSTYQSNASSPTLPTHTLPSNTTIFATLAAPLYHNVTPGDAWVFPSSPNDLGARDMSCECFNPDDQCCMPSSTNIAPFCMPTGSTCCGDTFCVAGESCCGEFCCAASTTCNLHPTNSGCCPIGALCTLPGKPICYDHASSNCTTNDKSAPPQQCCPPDAPFCRDFSPYGVGCYASSTTASSSTSSVQAMTAAGTGDIFAVVSSSVVMSTLTVTISVLPDGRGGISLEVSSRKLTGSEAASVGSMKGAVETTYVLDWLATATATTGGVVPAVTSSDSAEESTKTTVLSSVTGRSTALPPTTAPSESPSSSMGKSALSSSSSSSSTIQLCYDPNANSHSPCPSTTVPSSSPPPKNAVFNPPGATTVRSQASKNKPSFSLDALHTFFTSEEASDLKWTWQTRTYVLLLFCAMLYFVCAIFWTIVGIWYTRSEEVREWGKTPRVDNIRILKTALRTHGYDEGEIDAILAGPNLRDEEHDDDEHNDHNKEGSADAKDDTSDSEIETHEPPPITIIKGSARPLLEPRVVQKTEIRKVEGSARPFVKGKRTHSLWEGLRKRGEKEGEEEEEVAMNEMGEGEQDCERNTRDVGLGHIFVHRESQEGI